MTAVATTVPSRFRGPFEIGNGGYVSGLVAEAIGDAAKIRLHKPTPLDTPLTLVSDDTGARLMEGDTVLVEGEPLGKPLDLDPIPPPPDAEAIETARRYFPEPEQHLAPGCFVCGTQRDPTVALCLHTGRDPDTLLAADRWVPAEDLAGADGLVTTRYMWAALDCPSYFGAGLVSETALLAGIAGQVWRRPSPGETLVVTGWPLDHDGRKYHGGSVIHDEAGDVIAAARALWIVLKD